MSGTIRNLFIPFARGQFAEGRLLIPMRIDIFWKTIRLMFSLLRDFAASREIYQGLICRFAG